MKQISLSKKVGVSQSFISQIINRSRKPSWVVAKRLAKETGTTPVLWLEGSEEEIRKTLSGEIQDPYRVSDGCHAA